MLNRLPSRRAVKTTATVVLLLIAVVAGGAYHAAGKLLAARQRPIGAAPDDFPVEVASFQSDSGATIAGWYQRGEPGRGVVVLSHGIGSDRRSSLHRARLIADAGFSTLLIDLQSHGESTGDLIGLGHFERHDIRAAVAFAKKQNPGEPVGVVGFSLGGAATALAAPLQVDAVVLEAVYPAIEAAVDNRTERFGMLQSLASWTLLVQLEPRTGIPRRDLRPVDRIGDLGCPVMIVGGGRDKHTTPSDTRRLFEAAREPKELVWFDDWGHNNYARWDPQKYRATVVSFLSQHLAPSREGDSAANKKAAR